MDLNVAPHSILTSLPNASRYLAAGGMIRLGGEMTKAIGDRCFKVAGKDPAAAIALLLLTHSSSRQLPGS